MHASSDRVVRCSERDCVPGSGPATCSHLSAPRNGLCVPSRNDGSHFATRPTNSPTTSSSCSTPSPHRCSSATASATKPPGTLLCAAGDNPERLHTEAGYAALCGSSPVRVSSGKTNRHRLNRAGDRQANSALWTIVMVRIRSNHPPTIAYMQRRTSEGRTKREAIRCLKRYVAREIYNDIRSIITTTTTNQIAA